jgi:hypothetical protein
MRDAPTSRIANFSLTLQPNKINPEAERPSKIGEKWRQTVPKPMAYIVEPCYNLLRVVINDAAEIGRFGLLHG